MIDQPEAVADEDGLAASVSDVRVKSVKQIRSIYLADEVKKKIGLHNG